MHRLLEIQVNNAGLEKTLDQSVDIVMTTTGSRSESAGCRVAKHACKMHGPQLASNKGGFFSGWHCVAHHLNG